MLRDVPSWVSSTGRSSSSTRKSASASSSWRISSWRSKYQVSRRGKSHRWPEVEGSLHPWMSRWVWSIGTCCSDSCCIVCCKHSSCILIYGSNLGGNRLCNNCGTHLVCYSVDWGHDGSWTGGKGGLNHKYACP